MTPPVTPPVAPPVTPPVAKLLVALGEHGEMGNQELREHFGLRDRRHLREHYVDPALAEGLIEMTIPDKPTSRLQQYRLTEKGRVWVRSVGSDDH
jgi:ATP-dependent DNA helicase RecG